MMLSGDQGVKIRDGETETVDEKKVLAAARRVQEERVHRDPRSMIVMRLGSGKGKHLRIFGDKRSLSFPP